MLKKSFLGKVNNNNSSLQAAVFKTRNKIVFWTISITLFLLLASGGLLAFKLKSLPPQLPLFYSRPWGEMMLAKSSLILILPAVILILFVIDLAIYLRLVKSSEYLARILIFSLLVASLLITWTLFKIVLLVS